MLHANPATKTATLVVSSMHVADKTSWASAAAEALLRRQGWAFQNGLSGCVALLPVTPWPWWRYLQSRQGPWHCKLEKSRHGPWQHAAGHAMALRCGTASSKVSESLVMS